MNNGSKNVGIVGKRRKLSPKEGRDRVVERPKKSDKQEGRDPRERSQKRAGECEFDVARY